MELTKDLFHKGDLVLFLDPSGKIVEDYVEAVDPKVGNTITYGVQCKSHDISFNGGIRVWYYILLKAKARKVGSSKRKVNYKDR